MKRTYRSEAEMAALLDKWSGSGTSKRAFCEEHGLSLSVFRYWEKKLAAPARSKDAGPGFVPVEVRSVGSSTDPVRLTIRFADGLVVQIH